MNSEVPADAAERAVRELPVSGPAHEQYELSSEDEQAPEGHVIGPRGGYRVARKRRHPGLVFHTLGRLRPALKTLLRQEAA
ncbi:hypothetical protein [Streptomyces chartreusis]|uniref:hypothetical protein n=1 Tax=Streptomyces chartreusis TaxID=1969 RepID=UPI0036419D6D